MADKHFLANVAPLFQGNQSEDPDDSGVEHNIAVMQRKKVKSKKRKILAQCQSGHQQIQEAKDGEHDDAVKKTRKKKKKAEGEQEKEEDPVDPIVTKKANKKKNKGQALVVPAVENIDSESEPDENGEFPNWAVVNVGGLKFKGQDVVPAVENIRMRKCCKRCGYNRNKLYCGYGKDRKAFKIYPGLGDRKWKEAYYTKDT
jgi:hypothetical protein